MHEEVARELKLKVADIVLETRCHQAHVALRPDDPHSRFRVEKGHPEVRLHVRYGEETPVPYLCQLTHLRARAFGHRGVAQARVGT